MGDAKVIPFDDDSRGRRAGASGAGPGRPRTGRPRGSAAGTGPAAGGAAGTAAEGPQPPLAAVPDAVQEPGAGAGGGTGGDAAGAVPGIPAQSAGGRGGAGAGAAGPQAGEPGAGGGAFGAVAGRVLGADWDRRLASGLAFLRRRVTGEYEVDEFGYDAELTDKVLMSLLRPLYERYFRVEVRGVENIPAEGGALVVSNHSGTLPLDALMTQVAVHDHHPAGRHLRLLAADLVFMLPLVNELARKAGHTLACAEDAEVLLERGEVVGVMPEGFKGIGKPFADRYKLQRFGRGGFVATALKTKVPIVPCSVVGAEETYPMLGNARTVARLLGLPYFPLTPTFPWLGPAGLVPLPTKWVIQFGEPIPTDGYPPEAAEDPMLVFNLTDQVREKIQHTLYELLVQRRSVFF